MKLFIFGLGYSALFFARSRRALFTEIGGTVRGAAKAQALRAEGIAAHRFDGDFTAPEITPALQSAGALLVSIPPQGAGDAALARFGAALRGAKNLRSVIYLSTIGVYGDHQGAWIDERAALRATNSRNVARAKVEQDWLALGARTGKNVHVLRLAGIYGPGQNQLEKLKRGVAQRVVKKDQVFNRIHVEDIARAIDGALAHGTGGAWNVADDEPAPPQDVIVFAASLLGMVPPPEIDFDTAELSPMARSFYGDNKRVSNARMRGVLGVQLAFPTYREGLRAEMARG